MKTVVVLNGPKGVGKDYMADYLVENHGFSKHEMKAPLRELAHHISTVRMGELGPKRCRVLENDRVLKETHREAMFGNRTWREFMIWISEDVIKPMFGKNAFATPALRAVMNDPNDFIVFSDCGFEEERAALASYALVITVRVEREGLDFTGDSRKYLSNPDVTLKLIEGDFNLTHTCLDLLAADLRIQAQMAQLGG